MAEMTINGIDISLYNARLQDFSVGGTTVNNTTSAVGAFLKMPSLFTTTLGTRQLIITLTFFPRRSGENSKKMKVADRLEIAAENIARFEALLCGKLVEISLPDGFIYTSLVQTLPAAAFDSSGEHDVTYTFTAIRHKPPITEKVSVNSGLFCSSTTVTPYRLIVSVPEDCASITVMGITVNNVSANKKLVIDSEKGIITFDGINKFLDSDLTEFPVLNPGDNFISCSVENADLTVIYTPLYV